MRSTIKKPDLEFTTRCVLLFDVDGTLLTGPEGTSTAGLLAMNRAAARVTGKSVSDHGLDFAGRTDRMIARLLLAAAGESTPSTEQIDALVQHYLAFLAAEVRTKPYRALGTPEAVIPLLARCGAVIGLGTGNMRAGANIKLCSAGIAHLFNLSFGGFGDDGEDRVDLLKQGARRCDPSGELPVVIVGDTPRDVAAALALDAKCIGVPYRRHTAESLRRAGAHAIVEQIDSSLIEVVRRII